MPFPHGIIKEALVVSNLHLGPALSVNQEVRRVLFAYQNRPIKQV